MAASLFFCGLSAFKGWDLEAFVTLCFFIFTFNMTQGSVAWLYVPEVTVDAASGFCTSFMYFNLIILSFSFEFMINSSMKIYGTLWYFSGMTFVGFLFCIFFVRETRGLTDLEKKMLYTSKRSFDEPIIKQTTKDEV